MEDNGPQITARTDVSGTGWEIVHSLGNAADFHDRDPRPVRLPDRTDRFEHEVWVHRVEGPVIVLGSSQRSAAVDLDELIHRNDDVGVELCRRRSGGGVVYIDPATDLWIDVIVPSWSPLWDDDVARSFHWFGDLWAGILNRLAVGDAMGDKQISRSIGDEAAPNQMFSVARPSRSLRPSERGFFCFADVGHGEIVAGTSKVVGVSQRRTREWIRLQSLMVGRWRPHQIEQALDVALGLSPGQRADLGSAPFDAASVDAGLPRSLGVPSPDDLVATLMTALPGVVERP